MRPTGGVETNIEQGMVSRVVAGVRYALTGDWFGPGVPQASNTPPDAKGRTYQYQPGVNLTTSRKTEGISFHQLRAFAEVCDIVRLLIETRKDQVCSKSWVIRKIGTGAPAKKAKLTTETADPRVVELTKFFKKPDKQHSWSEWLRLLLEELFVIDAPTLYIQKTLGGDLYALRPVAGDTIKRVIDDHGWTPMAPDCAYQQILYGVPASNYTVEELIYKPRNPRANRIYGYSPVEQTVITAKQWLARQASNIEYYESGNLPEGFLSGGKGWTPEQLLAFQDQLDVMLSGVYAERVKVRAVPEGALYQAAKEPAMKSDYDEWLARIACFAFRYPPTAFIRQMNRTTSESAKEAGEEEGEAPIIAWVIELINQIIQERIGYDDLEFVFEDKEAQDPLQRAQIDEIYLSSQVLVPNEVRRDLGLEDREGGNEPLAPANAGRDTSTINDAASVKAPTAKAPSAKAPSVTQDKNKNFGKASGMDLSDTNPEPDPVDLDSPLSVSTRNKLAEAIAAALELSSEEVATQVTEAMANGEVSADMVVDRMVLPGLAAVESDLQQSFAAVVQSADVIATTALGIAPNVSLSNDYATNWAKTRAAQLITSDGTGGVLLDTTREQIRADVTRAVAEGWSNPQLAKVLANNYAFSPARAMMIARTEIAFAEVAGNMQAWLTSGVVKRKQWILGENACTICKINAAQGEIPLLQEFLSGDMGPPGHPNCRCGLTGKVK